MEVQDRQPHWSDSGEGPLGLVTSEWMAACWKHGKRTHVSREARESLPPCAGQATPPALSFLYQPLLEDWGQCLSNRLTFTCLSKVGPLPLAPPPTWPVCCHHAPSWRENSIKGYVTKDSIYRSPTGDQALNIGIFRRWTTSKPNQSKPQPITWKKNYFPEFSLTVKRKDNIYHRIMKHVLHSQYVFFVVWVEILWPNFNAFVFFFFK